MPTSKRENFPLYPLQVKFDDNHKRLRLQYASDMAEKDVTFWETVKFTDEKVFTSDEHGRVYVRR